MNEHPEINCPALTVEALRISGVSSTKQLVKKPFAADRKDGILALFTFVLGFYFARWVLFTWQGWGVTLFTLGYCGAVTLYLMKKKVPIPRAGWFWLAVVVLTGISFSLWTNRGLEPWRSLLLFGSAVYWIITATGLTILGKTSNWIMLDGFNALILIPFQNFTAQYKSLSFLARNRQTQTRQILSIGLGLFLTIIVTAMVLPLLLKADSGGFARFANGILSFFKEIKLAEYIFNAILAVPVAAYLFGLVAGSAHKRGSDLIKEDSTRKALAALRILPTATLYTLLGFLCSLYLIFIGSQLPYFFSAFAGQRPEGWQVYSEYARSGFFELCRIAAINLSVLLTASLFGKTLSKDDRILKALNSLLAVLTLVLIATAMSKMFLYIGAYGLSMRRLLPCLFMILLAVVCGGVVALQKWQFSIARLAVGTGVVMLCALCLINPDGYVARYNSERYLSGTLSSLDVEILYRSGPAGVDPALKVLARTDDEGLQAELKQYLQTQQQRAAESYGQSRDNWQWAKARERIGERNL